ncbi:MAG: zf-HC2 domain-containing protein [Planctomycetes bacterium]|nr:zf-HC2 domain-containing protein [Planctomycetota bacterium]
MKWTCKDLTENKLAYLDGSLPLLERVEMEEHLDSCSPCRREMEELRESWDLLDLYDEKEPSPDFAARTLAAFKQRKQLDKRRWIRHTVTALAASLLIAVAFLLYRSLTGTTPSTPAETPVAENTGDTMIEPELLESLDLIEDLDFLLEYGEDLELAMEYELYDILNQEESL